jgi:hypothetical protein
MYKKIFKSPKINALRFPFIKGLKESQINSKIKVRNQWNIAGGRAQR